MTPPISRAPLDRAASDRRLARRHLRVGWSTLLFFAALGTLLELLHALKLPWYLGVASETRRLMWTLAHAHGAALGLVNLALAAVCHLSPRPLPPAASSALVAGTILVPGGFLAGGPVRAWRRSRPGRDLDSGRRAAGDRGAGADHPRGARLRCVSAGRLHAGRRHAEPTFTQTSFDKRAPDWVSSADSGLANTTHPERSTSCVLAPAFMSRRCSRF